MPNEWENFCGKIAEKVTVPSRTLFNVDGLMMSNPQ